VAKVTAVARSAAEKVRPVADRTAMLWRDLGRSLRGVRWPDWAIPCLYLLAAVVVTWRMWDNPAGTVPTNGGSKVSADIYLNAWFLRYTATAISHGHLPALVTSAVNAPQGINAMWNTSMLLPSAVLTPVTLLAGPIVSLTILLTVGFAGSATSLFVVLRRWGASSVAAGVGGTVYGFSPAMLVAAEDHYHLQFAVLPPLIVSAALRLATGRGRVVRTGIWLGLLIAAQVFIAEELLVDTAVATAIVLLVLIACRPTRVPARIGGAAAGIVIAGVVALACGGHALWVQFHGPLAETGSPWRLGRYGNIPADFVTAPDAMVFHGQFRQFLMSSGQFLVECYAYLGWPVLALLTLTTILCWRDLRVRLAALTFALLELLSLGGHATRLDGLRIPATMLPWHWMRHIPIVSQALPQRLPILADGAAAVVLAFGVDRLLTATAGAPVWRRPVFAAVAVLALVPIIPRPVPGALASPSPPGFRAVVAGLHLRPDAPVLVLPEQKALAMEWQADSGVPISLIGGYCIAPDSGGHAVACNTYKLLSPDERLTLLRTTWLSRHRRGHFDPPATAVAASIAAWRPAAVIASAAPRTLLVRYLTRFFGPPTVRRGAVVGWRLKGDCGSAVPAEPAADPASAAGAGRLCEHPSLLPAATGPRTTARHDARTARHDARTAGQAAAARRRTTARHDARTAGQAAATGHGTLSRHQTLGFGRRRGLILGRRWPAEAGGRI
jgi:hypothetical protein